MFYGITTKMPVYYNMYSGSIPDKSCLEYMLINVKDIGIDKFNLVIDRGFPTNDNIAFMYEHGVAFVSAMPISRNDAKELINSVCGQIERMENRINEYQVYGVQRPFKIGENTVYAHIYFDNALKTKETNEHYCYIEKLHEELGEISKKKDMPKRYKDYFIINEQSKNEFTYELDLDKGNYKLQRMGYYILLSSDKNKSSAEILKIYRERDTIEKHFDQFKNSLEFKRLKTQSQKTAEGKIFIGFLALILRSYMLHCIKSNKDTKKLTYDKIMYELRKIRSVMTSNLKETITPLTSIQKNIMALFGISMEMIIN
jgi:transposase